MTPNEFIPYLDIPRAESDAETASRISLNSVCQTDALPSFSSILPQTTALENTTYSKRPLTISDICDKGHLKKEMKAVKLQSVTKRKTKSSRSSSAKRQKKITQSSAFCHICVWSCEQVALSPFSNVVTSICRKAMCQKCFDKHGMKNELEGAVRNKSIIKQFHEGVLKYLPEGTSTCPQCRNQCPTAGKCKIYAKTNRKRHLTLQRRRLERETHLQRKHEMRKNPKSNEKPNVYTLSGTSEIQQLPEAVASVLPEQNEMIAAMALYPPVEMNAPRKG